MKVIISFFLAAFLIGADLLARMTVQGPEQALATTAMTYGSAGLTHLSNLARMVRNRIFTSGVK
jgi:hypothetical protein